MTKYAVSLWENVDFCNMENDPQTEDEIKKELLKLFDIPEMRSHNVTELYVGENVPIKLEEICSGLSEAAIDLIHGGISEDTLAEISKGELNKDLDRHLASAFMDWLDSKGIHPQFAHVTNVRKYTEQECRQVIKDDMLKEKGDR